VNRAADATKEWRTMKDKLKEILNDLMWIVSIVLGPFWWPF
jgi:hypothetical protein